MDNRLNIAFVWHMHQPMYKDPFTGEYTMPWVLYHGTKDYYDMAAILDEFPDIHQTFNYVPCLVEQIGEYASGAAVDRYRAISAIPAEDLTDEDKVFILQHFFQANWEHMIRPLPRYAKLLKKRGAPDSPEEARVVLRYLTVQDFLDLQVLFNLTWIDPELRKLDKFLSTLEAKGKSFTEEEKKLLLAKQTEIVSRIVPKHVELQQRGVIEVTTSPYYHPILPLLCDSDSAREAMPRVELPKERFAHPEDASAQIRKAVEFHARTFGRPPRGMWPSEGSVSMDMLGLVADAGIDWLATDEEILTNTLKRPLRRDHSGNCYDSFLYRPYSINAGGRDISLIFRDHILSDLIGFDYARMHADAAASDLVARLTHIHGLVDNPADHVVPIILDGENAWETYANDGRNFLYTLYSKLSGHPLLKCVTVSEFLGSTPHRERLDWIFPGSWISHNFKIWIGHREDNAAWDYISGARKALVEHESTLEGEGGEAGGELERAWNTLYAAEGSDWFWWYGDEHSTMSDEYFDNLFRLYIKRVYSLIGVEPPLGLDVPIISEAGGIKPESRPMAFVNPTLDGEVTNYFEWLSAGLITRRFFGTAMHREVQGEGLIDSIGYGFSRDALFFRFDYNRGRAEAAENEWRFSITFLRPRQARVDATVKGTDASATFHLLPGEAEEAARPEAANLEIASGSVVELRIPLELLGAELSSEVRVAVKIDTGEEGVERWPTRGYLILDIPSEDFELEEWIV
ncbi:MAG: glycoside hydrolase family 57 protein [Thermodesulfobacteriota bacterium]